MTVIVFDDSFGSAGSLSGLSEIDGINLARLTPDVSLASDLDECLDDLVHRAVAHGVGVRRDAIKPSMATGEPKDIVFVVPVEWKLAARHLRADQIGVEVLKHIRLTKSIGAFAGTHVVLTSFQRAEELVRSKPQNLILLSKGVTVVRLPHRFTGEEFQRLGRILADTTHGGPLYPHIAASHRPIDSAHAMSNWWGVRQFSIGYHLLRQRNTDDVSLPAPVESAMKQLANKELLYLFEDDSRRDPTLSDYQRAETLVLEQEIQSHLSGSRQHTIVLVDDEAAMGWADVLRSALADRIGEETARCLRTVSIQFSDETFSPKWIQQQIIDLRPDLVLLDLRLRGSSEADVAVEETSGASVLRGLKEADCGLPIIMLTASNKYWTYRDTLRLGADGYWMKEGLGEHRPPVTVSQHYDALLVQIQQCLTGIYGDLRSFSRGLVALKQQQRLWWEHHHWPVNDSESNPIVQALQTTTANRTTVFSQIEAALFLLREYLRLFEWKEGLVAHHDPSAAAAEHRRAIVLAAGKIVEFVHASKAFQSATKTQLTGKQMGRDRYDGGAPSRKDLMGQRLFAYRSAFAHADQIAPKISGVRDYLAMILVYLSYSPGASMIEPVDLAACIENNEHKYRAYVALKGGSTSIDEFLARRG